MDKNMRIKSYRTGKVQMDFTKLTKGENKISLSIGTEIGLPEKEVKNIEHIIVKINVIFKEIETDSILLESTTEVFLDLNSQYENVDDLLSDAKSIAVPQAYNKTKEAVNSLIDMAKINFITLPDFLEDGDII